MNSNVSSTSVPPSFRGELYFLIAKFLENGPCKDTATRLKTELTEKGLLQPRYDWKGVSHAKTFRDMEEEFDPSGNLRPFNIYYKKLGDLGFSNSESLLSSILFHYTVKSLLFIRCLYSKRTFASTVF